MLLPIIVLFVVFNLNVEITLWNAVNQVDDSSKACLFETVVDLED